ncbi:MAG: hypothetical protein H6706_21610 [Myxococcales bacterium]|nr:hypothetical protein [Myxococcales bacterium]
MTEPRVVLAEEAPRAELVRYLATFEGDTRGEAGWAARLRRFWDENPTPGPWGWVLLDADRIVGQLALIPFLFQVDGAEVPGVSSSTWRVDARFRGVAAELLFRFRSVGRARPLLTTTPAPHVRQMLEKLRFTPLVPEGLQHLSVVPLAPTAALPGLRALGRSLAGPRRLLGGRRLGWRRADPARVDFDALWDRTRHAAAFTRVRDAARSRWFVGDRFLLVDGDPSDPQGFAVFGPGRWRGLPVVRLIDVWPPPQAPDAVRRLIRFLWTDPFGGQAAAALLHHPTPAFTAALAGAPALTRPAPPSTMLHLGRGLPATGRFFTLGEGDNAL